jgi:colanic acid/amylovoran biosynthesis protein
MSTPSSSAMRETLPPVVLILGGVTHENRGDLAMIEGLIAWLRETAPALEPVLSSWNPERSTRAFGVRSIPSPDIDMMVWGPSRWRRVVMALKGLRLVVAACLFRWVSVKAAEALASPRTVGFLRELDRARAMVVHGSGSFNSLWWYDWLYPKTACCLAGRVRGVPTVIASQGIGPLDHPLDRLVSRVFFRSVAFVGVRDGEASTSLAHSLGARRSTTWHTGDDSLLLKAESSLAADTALREAGVPDRRLLLGVNFRDSSSYSPSHREGGTERLARLLDRVADDSRAHVVFVPISYDTADDDRKSAAAVANAMANPATAIVLTAEYPAVSLRAIIGRMHLCIGTSYHFLLFALAEGVPALGLYKNAYYRQKQLGLFSLYRLDRYSVDMLSAGPDQIEALAAELLARRQDVAETLRRRNDELRSAETAGRAKLARAISAAR